MLRVAHFATFAPHCSGQYETVKDLIMAERSIGIDAQFVDYGHDGKNTVREGLVDGQITTAPLAWALDEADVAIRHTIAPQAVYDAKPVILALHGRPENSFRLEQHGLHPVISTIRQTFLNNTHAAAFTFWPELMFYWQQMANGTKVQYVPAPVDFDTYRPDGPTYDFGNFTANINLMVADIWREDHTPFNLIFAAQYFRQRYYPGSKIHIYGASGVNKNKCFSFLSDMQRKGVVGQVGGVTGRLAEIYRSADILLTPNIIATRIIRESMASGLPIVAPPGCAYTDYTAEPRDYKTFALEIKKCYENIMPDTRTQLRNKAKELFDNRKSAMAIKGLCETVLKQKDVPRWNAMSITADDWGMLKGFVEANNIKTITEFGPGISTELFDRMGLELTAYETNPQWVKRLGHKVPRAVIKQWDGKSMVRVEGDMAFIDGPHGGKNREVSYRSVYESDIPIVACHDRSRPEDKEWIDKYFAGWRELASNHDTVILRRP